MAFRRRRRFSKRGRRSLKKRRFSKRKRSAQSQFTLRRPKKKVVKQLAPIVETKKFRGIWNKNTQAVPRYEVTPVAQANFEMPTDKAFYFISPETFNRMQFADTLTAHFASATGLDIDYGQQVQAMAKTCIEGNSIFSRFLKAKLSVSYPRMVAAPLGAPRAMQVIWGWCNPLCLTDHTTPKQDNVEWQGIVDYIENTIKDDFDSKDDPLEFRDKERRLYSIIGRRKVVNNLNDNIPNRVSITADAGTGATMPNMPVRIVHMKWPTNKKVEYTKSYPTPAAIEPGVGYSQLPEFAYPNQAYLPFVLCYNPDFAKYDKNYSPEGGSPTPDTEPITGRFNDCHWFYDA